VGEEVLNTLKKHTKKSPFVQLDRGIVQDSRLSWKAKGLIMYLLDQAEDWQFYETEICKHSTDGRISVSSGLKELEECGYLIRNWIRDDRGRFIGRLWDIYEEPLILTSDPIENAPISNPDYTDGLTDCTKPDIGKSDIGKHATNNNNNNNNNSNEIIKNNKTILNNDKTNDTTILYTEDIIKESEAVVVDNKYISDIFFKHLEKSIPNNIIKHFLELDPEQINMIAHTLSSKKISGQVKNPLGLLISNPDSVIQSILMGNFYPDLDHNDRASPDNKELSEEIIAFQKLIGIDMKAIAKRNVYLKWRTEWGFSMDVVSKAGELMCMYTKDGGLEYIDSVLNNWMSKEIRTLADVEKEVTAFKNRSKVAKSPPGKRISEEYEFYVPPEILKELQNQTN